MKIRVSIFFLILGFFACVPAWSGLDVPAFTDSSKPVHVEKGHDFVLLMPADPAAGISWEMTGAGDSSILKYIGGNYEPESAGKGVQWFRFLPMNPGKTEISLRGKKSGESKEEKFQVEVV